jgi:hypothetical protein
MASRYRAPLRAQTIPHQMGADHSDLPYGWGAVEGPSWPPGTGPRNQRRTVLIRWVRTTVTSRTVEELSRGRHGLQVPGPASSVEESSSDGCGPQ